MIARLYALAGLLILAAAGVAAPKLKDKPHPIGDIRPGMEFRVQAVGLLTVKVKSIADDGTVELVEVRGDDSEGRPIIVGRKSPTTAIIAPEKPTKADVRRLMSKAADSAVGSTRFIYVVDEIIFWWEAE